VRLRFIVVDAMQLISQLFW